MALIDVVDLSFAYEGSYDNVFEHVSFQIDTDWKLVFVGRNGRGKTTFLNLLLGNYEYQGRISSNMEFAYFPYEAKDKRRMTIEILEEICPGFEQWRIYRELNLLEVAAEVLFRPFETLSHGERTKVMLAVLFAGEDRFLLIDEPTNHLDMEARDKVARYLNSKKGFILVSHDRRFLDACVDHILSINKMDIEVQKGTFSSWYANKEAKDQQEMEQNEKLKKEVRRLSQAARRSGEWSDKVEKSKKGQRVAGLRPDRGHIGHQAAKMMKRSKVLEGRRRQAVEEKSRLLKNIDTAEELRLYPLEYHTDRLAEFKNVSISYDGRKVCEGVNFEVRRGERICLRGRNGCGKSSILKMILGEKIPYTGEMQVGTGIKISYVPQDASFLQGSLEDMALEYDLDESLFKAMLRKLDLERSQFDKDIGQYSAGQKKKVLLARSLCQRAHLYIWDEPLNYIDVLSRIQIEQLLMAYKPAMIFVEHDAAFCEKVATKQVRIGNLGGE